MKPLEKTPGQLEDAIKKPDQLTTTTVNQQEESPPPYVNDETTVDITTSKQVSNENKENNSENKASIMTSKVSKPKKQTTLNSNARGSKIWFQPRRSEQEAQKSLLYKQRELEAEEAVRHNWLLADELKYTEKKFERTKEKLTIQLPDDDNYVAIDSRMQEVRDMASPRRTNVRVLDQMSPELRERVLKIDAIPVPVLRKMRRSDWTKPARDRFIWASKLLFLLRKYFELSKMHYNERNYSMEDKKKKKKKFAIPEGIEDTARERSNLDFTNKPSSRSSIVFDLYLSLTTQPHLRDSRHIRLITRLLRTTRAFNNLFPATMEKALSREVAYEKYEDGRLIACQGRPPERLYFIISGKVTRIRQFKLSSGHVTQTVGYLSKGMTTNPEELIRHQLREDSLVASGQVEVLVLDDKAFLYLQHSESGPPVKFLRSLELFANFPISSFQKDQDALEYTYYPPGRIIVQDSNRNPWLYVIMSGQAKIIRRQSVIDFKASNESGRLKLSNVDTGKRRESLPRITDQSKSTSQNVYQDGNYEENRQSDKATQELPKMPSLNARKVSHSWLPSINENETSKLELSSERRDDPDKRWMEKGATGGRRRRYASQISSSSIEENPRRRRKSSSVLHHINIPLRTAEDDDTEVDGDGSAFVSSTRANNQPQSKDFQGLVFNATHPQRRAYLQLTVLTSGDIFGLDHLKPTMASEERGYGLASDGTEVLKISKRFFLQHADGNTLLKVFAMNKQLITVEEARRILYEQELWSKYKIDVWRTTVIPLLTKSVD